MSECQTKAGNQEFQSWNVYETLKNLTCWTTFVFMSLLIGEKGNAFFWTASDSATPAPVSFEFIELDPNYKRDYSRALSLFLCSCNKLGIVIDEDGPIYPNAATLIFFCQCKSIRTKLGWSGETLLHMVQVVLTLTETDADSLVASCSQKHILSIQNTIWERSSHRLAVFNV